MESVVLRRPDCRWCHPDDAADECLCLVEVAWDGKTVWVNDAGGMAIGRYSQALGTDIHRDTEGQLAGGHCLDCRPAAPDGWDAFVEGMARHHGITVPAKARPG